MPSLSSLDIIQGINWLLANHIMLDYSNKTTMFPPLSSEAQKSVSLYLCSLELESGRSGSQGYILLMASKVNMEQTLSQIPIVREYPDVFTKDIPKFPPEREVEFCIDLVPEMGPIFIAPYKMSPLELAELKKQLEVGSECRSPLQITILKYSIILNLKYSVTMVISQRCCCYLVK